MAKRRFMKTLLIFTVLYLIWMLGLYFGQEKLTDKQAAPASADLSYSDLAAAYERLQQQLQKADSTHIIRRYHGRYALFNAQDAFDTSTMQLTREHLNSSKGKESLFLDLPDFAWARQDNARPVDMMRLTFRGNGIPNDVERLATSGLLEPKLHAFYNALIQPNTTLWTHEEGAISFDMRTAQGKTYQAKSTPFIAIQRLSKDHFAKMKAASLPFLWKAYIDEEKEKQRQNALLAENFGPPDHIGPNLPDALLPKPKAASILMGPRYPRTQAELLASDLERKRAKPNQGPLIPAQGAASVLEALPGLADALSGAPEAAPSQAQGITSQNRPSVDGFALDEQAVEALLQESLVQGSRSLSETLELKKAINNKRKKARIDNHIERLARLDPEFMALFLINNMFEQYNIFSVFDDDVYLTVNALDTRLNVLYVSYNLRFDPPKLLDLDEALHAGCNGNAVHISDEFFLIAAKPHSYLVRLYLPSCHLSAADYDHIDRFIEQIRILH